MGGAKGEEGIERKWKVSGGDVRSAWECVGGIVMGYPLGFKPMKANGLSDIAVRFERNICRLSL